MVFLFRSSKLHTFPPKSGRFFDPWRGCPRRSLHAASRAAAPIGRFGATACHGAAATGGADQTHPAEGARNQAGFDDLWRLLWMIDSKKLVSWRTRWKGMTGWGCVGFHVRTVMPCKQEMCLILLDKKLLRLWFSAFRRMEVKVVRTLGM